MCSKLGSALVEYMDPIDLMDCPSTMEIGSCWYQKGANNKWTYGLADHLMVDFIIIIALASITYLVDLNVYELLQGIRKSSTTLLINARVYIIHMIGVHYYFKIYLYTYVKDYTCM